MKISKLMLSSIVLLAGVAMVSCGDMLGNDESSVFSSSQEKFSTQAVTSLSMINSLGSSNGLVRKAKLISYEEKAKIEQILPTLDLLMNNGMIFESQVVEEVVIFNDVTYNGKIGKGNNITASHIENEVMKSTYTLEIENFHNGEGDFRYVVKYDFTDSSCSFTMDGTVKKQGQSSISDFSGKYTGRLSLKSATSCGGESNPYYTITVSQSGSSVKVNDGEFITTGSINAEGDGLYSQASKQEYYYDSGHYHVWKTSHILKRTQDGSYSLQVSITNKGSDGDGPWECNVKYLGTVVKK